MGLPVEIDIGLEEEKQGNNLIVALFLTDRHDSRSELA
jgi:hypothetical protein